MSCEEGARRTPQTAGGSPGNKTASGNTKSVEMALLRIVATFVWEREDGAANKVKTCKLGQD